MKYSININQLALSKNSLKIDVIDAAILEYIIDLCKSTSSAIQQKRIKKDDQFWTWIDLQTVCDEMPILRINSKGALTRRISKLKDENFISTAKKSINGHTRLFVKIEEKVDKLTFTKVNEEESTLTVINEHVDGYQRGGQKHVDENARIINTNNTIHNNTRTIGLFDAFWETYPSKKAKEVARISWSKIDPSLYEMIISDVTKRKELDRGWLEGYIPHPATYLNQKRWTDDITPSRTVTPNLPPGTTYTPGKFADEKGHIFEN